ncbi:hypothetical protein WN51_11062 [Melipona quadrifasciata]|uniref:Uncharacterized protein n=1 Tax=Melipona quadrifasciata TaxID=166423 RepID=A0A0M9A3X4_9HYME|nr:hypothetical protein WN51_11062 [Melipona quadrifasciata]
MNVSLRICFGKRDRWGSSSIGQRMVRHTNFVFWYRFWDTKSRFTSFLSYLWSMISSARVDKELRNKIVAITIEIPRIS